MTDFLPCLITAALALVALAWAAWNRARNRRATQAQTIARETLRTETVAADEQHDVAVRVAVEVRAEGEKMRPVDLFNEIGRMK